VVQEYWRCLEELSDKPEFTRYLKREFPRQAPRDMTPLSRRDFMKFMGARWHWPASAVALSARRENRPYVIRRKR
jgi:MoCo/4Fe-4S cofactor protein with predicted Tat translocation signal